MLDLESRLRKAEKIRRILEARRTLRGARMLDVGAGAGVIAHAFAEAVGPDGAVVAVDVEDQRVVTEGYEFRQVDDIVLPFPDESFDIAVSNHVIEHVGPAAAQVEHLREIRRVLKEGGCCYLATPSRFVLLEPHFGLPFLSWLPRALADRYIRLARRGDRYDCWLSTRSQLRRLIAEAGLAGDEATVEAMRVTAEEEPSALLRAALALPKPVLRAALGLVPTLVFVLRRPPSG